MKCSTALVNNRDETISERYVERPCEEAAFEFSDLEEGLYARHGTGPFSIYIFFLVVAVLAYLVQALLVQRRDKIISEVYSQLSIVKTKN